MADYQVVVVGGGNAGLSLTSYLLKRRSNLKVAVIEPSEKHYYQPAWTLVGAGEYDVQKTVRDVKDFIPDRAVWIKKSCVGFNPEANCVVLNDGSKISYEYLVVCPGIQLNWDEIKGLKETLGKNGVCSNYSFQTAPYTFECIKNFKGGNAIFHSPHTAIKCGGAPQKIMYLAADYFRKHGILERTNINYVSGGTRLFGVAKYEKTLLEVVKRYRIQLRFQYKLIEINGEKHEATFVGIGTENKDEFLLIKYDMIHVTPPQSAPDFVRQSPLADEHGWVNVDKLTLQHRVYKNIFSLGDAAGLPTSKTGAAVRKQMPVVAANLFALMDNKPFPTIYNGYSSCPIVTGYGKLVLAEFDYQNQPMETFPFDQSKERTSMYWLKKYILPYLYWNKILTGKM
ncbi:MAG: FAD/NAD(P)-binding oxidoreductase [Chitinophagales bacterium]|nr:FAD/NAD(P)-binding oxidoreductase [Chitinophagales bacterium]